MPQFTDTAEVWSRVMSSEWPLFCDRTGDREAESARKGSRTQMENNPMVPQKVLGQLLGDSLSLKAKPSYC